MTLSGLSTTSKEAANSTRRSPRLSISRLLCNSPLWLEDRGTEGVLGVEDTLLELVVGVLIALILLVIIVVLAPVEGVVSGLWPPIKEVPVLLVLLAIIASHCRICVLFHFFIAFEAASLRNFCLLP